MNVYHYSKSMLFWDGLRSILGLSATFGPLLLLQPAASLAAVLGGLGLIFFLFGLQVMMHWVSSIEVTPLTIEQRGLRRRSIAWDDLKCLKVAYYAPRKRHSVGWYRMILEGSFHRLKLESTIDGFEDILQTSLAAARARNLTFDPTTRDNLLAMGLMATEQEHIPKC